MLLHFRANAYCNGGQRPPPTFAAKRQRRDLIIAHPQVGVSKEGGPQPPLFGRFKGIGFLRKGGNRNPPFLKWRSLVTFFRQEKKVTRRRQKEESAPRRGAEQLLFRQEKKVTRRRQRKVTRAGARNVPLSPGKESDPSEAKRRKLPAPGRETPRLFFDKPECFSQRKFILSVKKTIPFIPFYRTLHR